MENVENLEEKFWRYQRGNKKPLIKEGFDNTIVKRKQDKETKNGLQITIQKVKHCAIDTLTYYSKGELKHS